MADLCRRLNIEVHCHQPSNREGNVANEAALRGTGCRSNNAPRCLDGASWWRWLVEVHIGT
jgi:hypothetical protein